MIRPFNAQVLVGNWYEDRVLEEDVIKDFLDRKNNGTLLIQKHLDQTRAEAQPINLSTSTDGCLHFGDVVQLRCDGSNPMKVSSIAKPARKDCYITGDFVRSTGQDYIATGGSAYDQISPKTVFVIRSVDGTADGSVLKFGQPFALSSYDGKYYLHSSIRSYDKSAHKSRLQETQFQSLYNHECDWVATCVNPTFRMEVEGRPVPANEKILILHMRTNKALAVFPDFKNSASFEIVCHTFLDSHKSEEDVNHWRLATNVPKVAQ